MWIKSYRVFKSAYKSVFNSVFKSSAGHAATSYSSVPFRLDHATTAVGFKLNRAARRGYLPLQLSSIVAIRLRSNGARHTSHRWAALRWLPAAELSVDDGADATGGEGERGDAHRAQGVTAMLNVLMVRRGARKVAVNCSPETWSASDGPGARRGWSCGSPRGKMKTQLVAQDQGEASRMKERARGGQFLPGNVAGDSCRRGGARSLSESRFWGTRG